MRNRSYFGCLLLLTPSLVGFSQQKLGGKIIRRGSTEVLSGVSVSNLNQKKYNISDLGGNYKIPATTGDTLLFSSAGCLPDTVIASPYMFQEDFLIPLTPHIVALPSVAVDEASNYQIDSIRRREDYAFILDKKHPVRIMNEKRPGDGPGLSFSPLGYFSSGELHKRRLKKRLQHEEEDDYIDYKFPRAKVSQFTGLKGDSLQLFMVLYRPSYKFCRSATSGDILLYINEKLHTFRTKPVTLKL